MTSLGVTSEGAGWICEGSVNIGGQDDCTWGQVNYVAKCFNNYTPPLLLCQAFLDHDCFIKSSYYMYFLENVHDIYIYI